MNKKSLHVLEFDKIKEMLKQFAVTDMGRSECDSLLPFDTLEDAEKAQQETEEALSVLAYRGDSPLLSSTDVRPALDRAFKGAVLSLKQLMMIAESLRAARFARNALVMDGASHELLATYASRLQPNKSLETDLNESILSEEELADTASAELADIRRHIRLCNDKVKERLQAMIHQPLYSKYLQEPLVTVRNGRYVIPVKQEYRQNVQGLIHDQSATGATLFIEPISVLELGNELKQWLGKEEQEIERILSAFSASIVQSADVIENNINVLAYLDMVFAKARLAQEMDAVRPRINKKGYLRFVQVRHPLIPRETVVPCSLWLGDAFTSLIITGPNTGGKTVTLKTVGLITLMGLSGMHVPGQTGTEISVFRNVFADIGDEQSIEQSLSTFSSHLTNIVHILEDAEPGDLVLFDELGAGTDPTEGAALAEAILERLLRQRIHSVATTHYSELKAFALSTPGAENASVEFDVATLKPTYRLSIGIPGKSNAFEISKRLGLPASIIEKAKEKLSHESVRFEDVIANAEYHRQIAKKEREIAEQMHHDAIQARKQAEGVLAEAQNRYDRIEKRAKEEARTILENTKRESARIITELKLLKKSGGQSATTLQELQKGLTAIESAVTVGIENKQAPILMKPEDLHIGDEVILSHLGSHAVILAKPDAKGEVQVQAGIIKMKVPISRLKPAEKKRKTAATQVHAKLDAASRSISMECDVRGLSLDEALMEVDQYLDMAIMSSLHEVYIIHGKGTGTLRAGIQKHLKALPAVSRYRMGNYGEGEAGVTVVTLK